MTKQVDLVAYLFEGQLHAIAAELQAWMDTSSRFTAFVDTYRDKIRKKIRVTRDPESLLDLRAELEMAYCLLNDRRLAVAYEPYASTKRRGPDFSITYRTNLVLNIEVARLRVEGNGAGEVGLSRKEERILRILLYKLGQMQPGMANLLAIHTHPDLVQSIDLAQQMLVVKTRVEGKDPSFYAATRYSSPAAFYKDFLHLSGVLLWASPSSVGQTAPADLWINKQARPLVDEKVLRRVWSIVSARDAGDSSQLRGDDRPTG